MVTKNDLCLKYSLTPNQGELLEEKLKASGTKDETQIISFVTQIVMLSQKLEQLGFEPTMTGCEQFTSCIPANTRSFYSASPVDAAIEYLSKTSLL